MSGFYDSRMPPPVLSPSEAQAYQQQHPDHLRHPQRQHQHQHSSELDRFPDLQDPEARHHDANAAAAAAAAQRYYDAYGSLPGSATTPTSAAGVLPWTATVATGSEHPGGGDDHLSQHHLSVARQNAPQDLKIATTNTSSKARRRSHGGDHVKHRRTRSGCYTCRNRRVKCDETRPICDRCRKGSRECEFPIPNSAGKKPNLQKTIVPEEPSSSSSGEDNDDLESPTELPSRGNETSRSQENKPGSRKSSRVSKVHSASIEQVLEQSLSPSTESSSQASKYRSDSTTLPSPHKPFSSSSRTSLSDLSSLDLSPDHLFYLNYHRHSMSCHHYFLKHDPSNLINGTMIEAALSYEPLMYAVVGFAAFHHAVAQGDAKIKDFMEYYNKSVVLFRMVLASKQKPSESTILTILALATFEEYLGDWGNLINHQRAACELITMLYTPETIVQREDLRRMLAWYCRFDVHVSMIKNSELSLGSDWLMAYQDYCAKRYGSEPDNFGYKIEYYLSQPIVFGAEMARMGSRMARSEVLLEEVFTINEAIGYRISAVRDEVEQLVASAVPHLGVTFDESLKPDPEDIVNPYETGTLLKGPGWAANYLLHDLIGLEAMHRNYTNMIRAETPSASSLVHSAFSMFRIFESIELWPESPPGALLPMQSSLGLACLFVPRDEKLIAWCLRKLAKIESLGYLQAPAFREKLADLWGIPSLRERWFPEKRDAPIINAIRSFIYDRSSITASAAATAAATSASSAGRSGDAGGAAAAKPWIQEAEEVRSMKSLFSNFSLEDQSVKNSPESAASEVGSVKSGVGGGVGEAGSSVASGSGITPSRSIRGYSVGGTPQRVSSQVGPGSGQRISAQEHLSIVARAIAETASEEASDIQDMQADNFDQLAFDDQAAWRAFTDYEQGHGPHQ